MSANDVTGDALITKAQNDKYREGWDRIFGKTVSPTPPYDCLFCGRPSWVDPSDQTPPPDYCHESDHGEPE